MNWTVDDWIKFVKEIAQIVVIVLIPAFLWLYKEIKKTQTAAIEAQTKAQALKETVARVEAKTDEQKERSDRHGQMIRENTNQITATARDAITAAALPAILSVVAGSTPAPPSKPSPLVTVEVPEADTVTIGGESRLGSDVMLENTSR